MFIDPNMLQSRGSVLYESWGCQALEPVQLSTVVRTSWLGIPILLSVLCCKVEIDGLMQESHNSIALPN